MVKSQGTDVEQTPQLLQLKQFSSIVSQQQTDTNVKKNSIVTGSQNETITRDYNNIGGENRIYTFNYNSRVSECNQEQSNDRYKNQIFQSMDDIEKNNIVLNNVQVNNFNVGN